MKYLGIVLLLFVLSTALIAQDTCSLSVDDALAVLGAACDEIERDQLCYGHKTVSVTTTNDDIEFGEAGNIISILDVTSIQTSPYAEPDEWGIALMEIQANIPATLPGQGVRFLLFGDTELTVDNEAEDVAPMQAVYFSSGIGASVCNDVPENGILIHSPEHDEFIELVVNDVEIKLGSTAYLQAEAGNEMTVYLLEGFATVTATDETVNLVEGTFTTIAIDDDLHVTGTPAEPQPYAIDDVETVPVSGVDAEIEIAEPATEERIAESNVGFVGSWSAGIATMSISPTGGNTYRVTTVNPDPPDECNRASAIGVGTWDGEILSVNETWTCNEDPSNTSTFTRNFSYDPDAGTLTNVTGSDVWSR